MNLLYIVETNDKDRIMEKAYGSIVKMKQVNYSYADIVRGKRVSND